MNTIGFVHSLASGQYNLFEINMFSVMKTMEGKND